MILCTLMINWPMCILVLHLTLPCSNSLVLQATEFGDTVSHRAGADTVAAIGNATMVDPDAITADSNSNVFSSDQVIMASNEDSTYGWHMLSQGV